MPIMRLTIKTHKNPLAFRDITNGSNTHPSSINALTQLSLTTPGPPRPWTYL
jgi:hypothetical protein